MLGRGDRTMGETINQNGWGVCGFVGVLNALHQRGKLKSFDKSLTIDQIHDRLGAEILTYLKLTKVEKPELGMDILKFTQSFGEPYSNYKSLDEIIDHFKLTYDGMMPKQLGVALSAKVIEDYARSAGLTPTVQVLKSTTYDNASLLTLSGCIVGLGDGNDLDNPWGGLKHWVYVTPEGHLLNWGIDVDLHGKTQLPNQFNRVTNAIKLE
jgi:hypothetical protein